MTASFHRADCASGPHRPIRLRRMSDDLYWDARTTIASYMMPDDGGTASGDDLAPGGVSDQEKDSLRIAKIDLDERSLARAPADIEYERKVAIYDLLEANYFEPLGGGPGPFELVLSIIERRLVFDVRREGGDRLGSVHLSLMPLRKIIKDYFLLCESYHEAIRNAAPAQIETVDMARRAMHNEGSEILRERLSDKINLDYDTARRLFTLICSFHMR